MQGNYYHKSQDREATRSLWVEAVFCPLTWAVSKWGVCVCPKSCPNYGVKARGFHEKRKGIIIRIETTEFSWCQKAELLFTWLVTDSVFRRNSHWSSVPVVRRSVLLVASQTVVCKTALLQPRAKVVLPVSESKISQTKTHTAVL